MTGRLESGEPLSRPHLSTSSVPLSLQMLNTFSSFNPAFQHFQAIVSFPGLFPGSLQFSPNRVPKTELGHGLGQSENGRAVCFWGLAKLPPMDLLPCHQLKRTVLHWMGLLRASPSSWPLGTALVTFSLTRPPSSDSCVSAFQGSVWLHSYGPFLSVLPTTVISH